jgi:hypothetical protein
MVSHAAMPARHIMAPDAGGRRALPEGPKRPRASGCPERGWL